MSAIDRRTPGVQADWMATLDSLPEEVIVSCLLALRDVPSVLAVASCCSTLRKTIRSSLLLWRQLTATLLGAPLVTLHRTAWCVADDATFHRRLLRAAIECREFCYANSLRRTMSDGWSAKGLEKLLCATGHTATGVGHLIAVIGGWRPSCEVNHLHVLAVDVHQRQLRLPELCTGSARPLRRLRHASCAVERPAWAHVPAGAPELPSVLVLGGAYDGGGHSDESEREGDELTLDRGDPIPGGLFSPCLLTFTTRDGSCCKWQQAEANGDAPAAIWHHSASSFRSGTRVVVFGGDMPEADPEMVDFISDRTSASAVYVLDVGTLNWSRVMCKGDPPSWRSLHVGLSFSPFGRGNKSPFGDPNGEGSDEQGGNEQLIVLGGTDEHTACFSSGAPGDFVPRTLDLVTFNWQEFPPPPEDALQATRRMRFAAEIYGERLLIYSGHGDDPLPASQRLVALHLRTMRWEQMRVRNRPICFADTPSACLSGGLIVGGVQMSFFGIRPCSKLDVLC